jgi:N-6 DNA Methylase
MTASAPDLADELQRFGALESGIVHLAGSDEPEHLAYLDLRRRRERGFASPDWVVEVERRPVLYAVRGKRPAEELEALGRLLAQRGQADYLATVEPGRLTLVELRLGGPMPNPRPVRASDRDAVLTIPTLAYAPTGARAESSAVALHDELLKLLNGTTDRLERDGGVASLDALSLMGRAMFLRFLIDRGIVAERLLPEICPSASHLEACLSDVANARRTFGWLDQTFNGDLLPLSVGGPRRDFWHGLDKAKQRVVCDALTDVLERRDPSGQMTFDWAKADFGHIPVGLLSQVYEHYSHRDSFEPGRARKQSVYYTPRAIAEYVVAEALFDLPDAHRARVLDPSVGGGVFLVAALRELVAARWRHDGARPGRAAIRSILHKQLCGFDINEAALGLTALSLYLTALELDPDPRPTSALRFASLRGSVLHDMCRDGDDEAWARGVPPAGSLGRHVRPEHRGAYDVVVGNPPWTSWERPKLEQGVSRKATSFDERIREVEEVIGALVAERLGEAAPRYSMVDFVPDLPFCWRALEWLRPGGRVGFALHGRLLFKRSDVGAAARSMLFQGARVTGVLNGAALRKTRVWPQMEAPFCLWFAENMMPRPGDGFHFVSPMLERALNQRGILRVDSAAVMPVQQADVVRDSSLLKTLSRGTPLDVSVVQRLLAQGFPRLVDYWKLDLGLKLGEGFQKGDAAGEQKPAGKIYKLPMLTKASLEGDPAIDASKLPRLLLPTLRRPKDPAIYEAPLVLVPEAPRPPTERRGRAFLARERIAYNESFFGFSCHGHPHEVELAKYLLLLLTSQLVPYVALMQSSKLGVERDVYLLEDIKAFPVKPFERLSSAEKSRARELADAVLTQRGGEPWGDVDAFVASLYGLTRWDREVIEDTLAVCAPFAESKDKAERPPTQHEIGDFVARLGEQLRPFLRRRERPVAVVALPHAKTASWVFLSVRTSGARQERLEPSEAEMRAFLEEADRHGASMVILRSPERAELLIGQLAQYRYWTPSRARLLALDLRWQHEDYLAGEECA